MVNYFNYFTEIEEHFQQARQSGFFLLSPLDWAMIETWKESGIPLEAVQKGIDRAFEKWNARKQKTRRVNSLAYCAQEVLTAAREMADGSSERDRPAAQAPFTQQELATRFRENAELIRLAAAGAGADAAAIYDQTADSLGQLAAAAESGELTDFEALEQRLTVLEERLIANAMRTLPEEDLVAARQAMQRQLAAYRGKMSAEQIAMLEKQYLQRSCLQAAKLPRLSLFYL
jgi:hypothetical protein